MSAIYKNKLRGCQGLLARNLKEFFIDHKISGIT